MLVVNFHIMFTLIKNDKTLLLPIPCSITPVLGPQPGRSRSHYGPDNQFLNYSKSFKKLTLDESFLPFVMLPGAGGRASVDRVAAQVVVDHLPRLLLRATVVPAHPLHLLEE